MNAPRCLERPRRWALRHLRGIRRQFHERAFGEELARVNLDLSPGERRAYLAWMREHSRRNGISPTPNYSVAWMLELEAELARESALDLVPAPDGVIFDAIAMNLKT